jgi:hypothetical protein
VFDHVTIRVADRPASRLREPLYDGEFADCGDLSLLAEGMTRSASYTT